MTSLYSNNPSVRDRPGIGVQYIAGRITMIAAGNPAAVKIGRLPAGCLITSIISRVATAFSGGTPVFGVGTTAALVGTNANLSPAMAIAAGSQILAPSVTVAEPLVADTDVFIGTTGGATAGDALVALTYINPPA